MAKTSSIYRNLKRVKMAEKYANRRLKLKNIADDKNASPEETAARLEVVDVVFTGSLAFAVTN